MKTDEHIFTDRYLKFTQLYTRTHVEEDRPRIWQRFADRIHLFAGTPSSLWLNHTLHEVFGIRENVQNILASANVLH